MAEHRLHSGSSVSIASSRAAGPASRTPAPCRPQAQSFESRPLVTIENAEVKNGLTPEMAARLVAVCEEIDGREDLGAAVIRGAGGTFCSGADTRRWGADIDWAGDEGFELLSAVYRGFMRVGSLEVPTIAAVRGAAVGAGMNLMLACDARIVAADARLVAGFLRIGLHPGGGFFSLLGRLGGREATAALGLFGAELTGAEAVSRGIAWEDVADAEVEGRALELAAFAARDPLLARRALASLRTELGPPAVPWKAALEMERGVQTWSMRRRFAGGSS
ncbi:MAG: enoyl-CoA hydratase/isomerase family protein [Actinobacteria bacterium]|nr:enoyl-CoA hydratase/isomerase family protein [Actinomycetota bacterium]